MFIESERRGPKQTDEEKRTEGISNVHRMREKRKKFTNEEKKQKD